MDIHDFDLCDFVVLTWDHSMSLEWKALEDVRHPEEEDPTWFSPCNSCCSRMFLLFCLFLQLSREIFVYKNTIVKSPNKSLGCLQLRPLYILFRRRNNSMSKLDCEILFHKRQHFSIKCNLYQRESIPR